MSPSLIFRYVRRECRISQEELVGVSRSKRLIEARRLAVFMLRENAACSFREISGLLGGRNHATLLKLYRYALAMIAQKGDFSKLAEATRLHCQSGVETRREYRRQGKMRASFEDMLSSHASVTTILRAVCDVFDLASEDLKGPSRVKSQVKPRYIAIFLLRNDSNKRRSFPVIGKILNRHHTTVMYGYDRIALARNADSVLAADIERVRARYVAVSPQ